MREEDWTRLAVEIMDGGGDLEQAAWSDWEPVRFAAASRPDLPDDLVRALASDPSESVRAAIAARPGLPADLMDQLAGDDRPAVLRALAARDGLDRSVRDVLARIPDAGVQRMLGNTRIADLLDSMPAPPAVASCRRRFALFGH